MCKEDIFMFDYQFIVMKCCPSMWIYLILFWHFVEIVSCVIESKMLRVIFLKIKNLIEIYWNIGMELVN